MRTIVEAVDLVVGEPPSSPFSMHLQDGEILALLFPPGRPRAPLVRALAGIDPPRAGVVRFPYETRVAIANDGSPLTAAFELRPDLVLVDGLDHLSAHAEREAWVRIASERERGASVVLATASADVAYRSDRVSLAMWEKEELHSEIDRVRQRMHDLVRDVLDLMDAPTTAPGATRARELRRLRLAASALLSELRRLTMGRDERLSADASAAVVTSELLSDRALDTLIEAEEDGWPASSRRFVDPA